jgi:hypothetical protein
LNPTAIFSKTGKGVQEASGKTSHLSRADRAVLKEIDGKTALADIAVKFEKISADKFDALIAQFDKDGYIREVSSSSQNAPTPARSAPPPKAPPPPPAGGDEEEMDFTQAIKLPPKAASAAPKAPPVDLAAASRADAERKAKEQQAFDYKARQEAEAKAKAESEARARAEAQARAAAEKARAEAEARTKAEADAKVKAAREAAVRMATEVKAKAEAAAEREREEKARLEAELNAKLDAERKAREDAERRAAEAAERARKELEEKARRDAEEMRQRLEAEMKAKLDAERKAREAEDRKRREEEDRKRAEEDRKRREEDERRRKEEAERRAKEEAERRAREEADRKRREEEDRKRAEEDRKRREEDERRRKEEAERRAKEEAERRAREEADRKRAEEDKRRKDDEARRAKAEAEEKARAAQAAASQSASQPAIKPVTPPQAPAAAGGLDDSLLADLDSFGKREEEEQREKEEAERQAKEEAARKAKAEAERRAKDDAERRAKEEADRKRREEEKRKAKEEAEQQAREQEERKKEEEAARKRQAKEALAAKEAERKAAQRPAAAKPAAAAAGDEDIEVTDEDLDMDDVKKDEKAMSATARKAQKEREQAAAIAAAPAPRPKKWGKRAAIALFVLLIGGVGVLQFMPVSTAEYEKAASDALGVPVKIGSARLSVITGIEARFESVSVGDSVKIKTVRGYPDVGTLFGGRKSFSRIELEGVSLSQSQLAGAVLGKASGENFRVAHILVKQATLDGPLTLPALDVDAVVSGDGSLQSVSLRGGDKLVVQLSPKGSDIGFEISAGSLALPVAPGLTLSEFGMKGTANRDGVIASEFDGRAFDGVISGTAKVRWGANWALEGEVRARGVRIAVLAPALVSEGKVDGRGNYTMSGTDPAKLFEGARMQGEFKIDKGVLGSFDLTRALQTGGAQSSGRTVFSELTGQAVYDKGAVKISNVAVAAGAMNAGATLDIDANGGLSGRVVADVKTPNQTLRATLNISGKIQDPVIRK